MTTRSEIPTEPQRSPRHAIALFIGEDLPEWAVRAGALAVTLTTSTGYNGSTGSDDGELNDVLDGADCVLVDADSVTDPLAAARRVHRTAPEVQVVVVTDAEERRRGLQRAMLFTPGIGEVWLASSGEVGGGIAERAAGVSRQRRKFRRTRERLERERIVQSPQQTERALVSDAYLADLLQLLPEAVFSVDGRGRIRSANPAAEEILHESDAPLVGSLLTDALGASPGSSDQAAITETLKRAGERPASVELAFRRVDGSSGHGELLVSRMKNSKEAVFVVVLHDLTDRHHAQRQLEDQTVELEHQASLLQDQAMELEQANEELTGQRASLEIALASRSRFYASMSHELRTPINAIIGYTSLALEGIYGELDDRLRTSLGRARRAATHLHELVGDVLDLAKVEAGRIEIQRQPVRIVELAEDILLSVQPSAQATGTLVECEVVGDLSEPLSTDPRRVRQILLNLLGNAVKFGAGRPVTLRCSPTPAGVALSVVDSGPGIPESEQEHIFEEFVQLDPEVHQGTGLGLPISRRLAELLGGTLTVSATPGRGSTFTLNLPRTAPGRHQDS